MNNLYILLILTTLFFGCKKLSTPAVTTIEYKQIDKITPNLLSLDIYYNSLTEQKKPVVLYVHGGGWAKGDKAKNIDNKINLFQSLNYVFVSINYRLSPFPYELENPDRIMFPTHNRDLADAIKWTVENISSYGGDTTKIALLGHSAGAQMVALMSTNSGFLIDVGLNLSNIKGVAVIDTEGYNVKSKVEKGNRLYINAFGTDSNQNILASPIYNIKKNIAYPKFFIVKRGDADRIKIADDFINKLKQNNVSVWQVDGSVYNHNEINQAIGQAGEEIITNELKLFFNECFEEIKN